VLQEERALRNNKNYETLDTNKSGVRFRSPALSDLNSEYVQTRDHYAEQQRAIVNEIINIAGKNVTVPPGDWGSSQPSQK
jgi:DNA mismatch repair protein MSH2